MTSVNTSKPTKDLRQESGNNNEDIYEEENTLE